jgi:hypothetical protein
MQMLNTPYVHPNAAYLKHQAELKRKQKLFAADYETEKTASDLVRRFLDGQEWEYQEQVNTGAGNRIDFVVDTLDLISGKQIKFGIECKRRMSMHYEGDMAATVLADYLEQAAGYSRSLNLPVFLGPIQSNVSPSSAYIGGSKISSLSALNIFGGRFNVGTMIVGNRGYTQDYIFFILRGDTFWDRDRGFNPKRLNMVTSTGSKKQRTSL